MGEWELDRVRANWDTACARAIARGVNVARAREVLDAVERHGRPPAIQREQQRGDRSERLALPARLCRATTRRHPDRHAASTARGAQP